MTSRVGYASGVFDLFHIGHLNLLRRARAECDHLIVGVATDDYVLEAKGRPSVVSFGERLAIVRGLRIVDEVVPDVSEDKTIAWQHRRFDVIFKGDDWKDSPKGDRLEATMRALGVEVVYFQYTQQTSSTMLREYLRTGQEAPAFPGNRGLTAAGGVSWADDVPDAAPSSSAVGVRVPSPRSADAVMVTGGAGYIGAHVVEALLSRGHRVVVVDNRSTGDAQRVPAGVPLVEVDLAAPGSPTTLANVARLYGITAVVHLAGRKQVAESIAEPAWYFRQNVDGLLALHDAMAHSGVRRLVFSSSASVYGDVAPGQDGRVRETDPTAPISPYAQTKLAGEWLNRAAGTAWGLQAVNLRYFNVAGAARPELADPGATNLIPMVFECLDRDEPPRIFGDDYATPDGTCVRDFIDVRDLAEAHIAALGYLTGPMAYGDVFNVGTGNGLTVAQVVQSILHTTGATLAPIVEPRRPGDPAAVVADVDLIRAALGWKAERGIDAMVRSAWQGWRARAAALPLPASAAPADRGV